MIECKRLVKDIPAPDFDPLSSRVIDQALNYAVKIGAPIFATTNGEVFALFKTPFPGEAFRLDTHRLFIKEIRLNEVDVEEILIFASRWHTKSYVRIIEIDWLFILRLRSFVIFLSRQLIPVIKKLETDSAFNNKLQEFLEDIGKISTEQLAREAAYLLMNKIVFYKILERYYPTLSQLKPIHAPSGVAFIDHLKRYYTVAIEVTKDFEPVFITGIYDDIPLPDLEYVFEDVNAFIEDMETYKLEEIGADIVGHIYEELIPDEERHLLGQFYTPPSIAELITKWAIRTPDDIVLDPGVGSGTFPVKVYLRLMEFKSKINNEDKQAIFHKEILSQIYGIDINPFPAHLTAINLAMRDVKHPTSEINIVPRDFFDLRRGQAIFMPYIIQTPDGEVQRKLIIPNVDAVVGNPPYTRWVEISEKTKDRINGVIRSTLSTYGLTGGIGNETGEYIHFIIHSADFLKSNGRLGMIISNSWLQADYGIPFVKYLLNHFKVKAVIDFNQRLFRIPLIATCVLLLEKEDNSELREKNKTMFLYIDEELGVEEILDIIEKQKSLQDGLIMNALTQGELSRTENWITEMFKTSKIEERIRKSRLMKDISLFFEPRYSNIKGVASRGGTGGDKFFFLTRKDAANWNLSKEYLVPLLASPRWNKNFTFTEDDWELLKEGNKPSYVFICHKAKDKLPDNVKEYIKRGETVPLLRTRKGDPPKTVNESMASRSRAKKKDFKGWYDLVGTLHTSIFTARRAQYHHRFVLAEFPNALDDSLITFIYEQGINLTNEQVIAILSYLNSDFSRFFVEIYGRSTGGGAIELDVKSAGKIPVLDVTKLTNKQVKTFNTLFEKLESKTRKIEGAETKEKLAVLQPIVDSINEEIAKILGIEKDLVEEIKKIVSILAERRISRTGRPQPGLIKGNELSQIKPPKKRKAFEIEGYNKSLKHWM